MPGRKENSTAYRYGFNGKEKDQNGEWGSQTVYDYGFRIYNPAIAKFLSVDPLTASYPWYTPYQFAGNKPIYARDLDGLEEDQAVAPKVIVAPVIVKPVEEVVKKTIVQKTGEVIANGAKVGGAVVGVGLYLLMPATAHAPGPPDWDKLLNFSNEYPDPLPIDAPFNIPESPQDNTRVDPTLSPRPGPVNPIPPNGDEEGTVSFFRAMSNSEYLATGGYLQDRNAKGEGPHVRRDIEYLTNAQFIKRGDYDLIVEYKVSKIDAAKFEGTPFQFTTLEKGPKPQINLARGLGLWYKKFEGNKGPSYGFPGISVATFNGSVVGTPTVIKEKKNGEFTNPNSN